MASSSNPNSKLSSTGMDFTPTIHQDTYAFIKPEQFDLNGRNVFITGASKGIGRHTALSFARAGASKIALGARSEMKNLEQEIKDAAEKASRKAPTVLSIKLDVTNRQSTEDAAKKIDAEFGGLDILINNAGYLENFAKVVDSDPEEWWKVWEVNIKGPYLVARATIPLLLKKNKGLKTILNVSSLGAHFLAPGGSGYMMTKLALVRFGEFLNAEHRDEGLLSYAIHPGGVDTELAQAMPKNMHGMLTDQPGLAGDAFTWLTAERRDWLAGRWIAATWDMEQLLGKKDKVVKNDLLKIRMDVGLE